MEQRDFILREIERLGQVLSAIRQKLFGGKDRLAISVENEVDDAKGMLRKEVEFDFDKLLNLSEEETTKYLGEFKAFDAANIEQLADYMAEIGASIGKEKSKVYLQKALHLYGLTNLKTATYSFEREAKIKAVINDL